MERPARHGRPGHALGPAQLTSGHAFRAGRTHPGDDGAVEAQERTGEAATHRASLGTRTEGLEGGDAMKAEASFALSWGVSNEASS